MMATKLSQTQRIIEFLKANENQKFNARDIALEITQRYSHEYAEKRNNPRFADESDFLAQIIAEIGSRKEQIIKQSPCINSIINSLNQLYIE